MKLGHKKIGNGTEKVMVIHGWKTDRTCFEPMIPSLDLDTYTYVFVDQRGYGESIDHGGPYTIKQVATDMIGLAGELGWDKYHIIGHSMGGKVMQQIMVDKPESIKCGIGVTPCPAAPIPFDEEGWSLFSAADKDASKRLEVFRLSTANRYTDTWYKMINKKSLESSTPEAFRAYLDEWVNYDLIQAIEGCEIPVKVITGEHDADLTAEVMKMTYGVWFKNVEITTIADCGHYPMFETPLSLAAECQTFLNKHH